jgi:Na+:H+ antiporter, NhaA family
MSEARQVDAELARPPGELVDRLTKPFGWFFRIEAAGGAVLLSFTVAALVLSNSPWALQVAEIAARETLSPVERLEIALHPWVGFAIMPLLHSPTPGYRYLWAILEIPSRWLCSADWLSANPLVL